MPQDTRDKLAALTAQRSTMVDESKILTKQRAAAKLNGTEFTGAFRLDELTRELQELDDTIELATQMIADDEEREIALVQAERVEKLISNLEDVRDQYLAEVERLQKSAEEMAGSLSSINQLMPKLAALGYDISGFTNMPDLQPVGYEARVISRIAETIAEFFTSTDPLGRFRVARVDSEKWLPSWAADERRRLSNLLGTPMLKARKKAQMLRLAAVNVGADE